MNRTRLKVSLVKHEGLRLKPYTDTKGKLTIGVGRNLTDDGLSECEVQTLLDNDINAAFKFCTSRIACFGALDDVRQNVLIEMAFNLGGDGLLKFHKMLAALERPDFDVAAAEIENSHLAPARRSELAAAMRSGA